MNPDNFRWKQLLTEAPHTFRQLLVKIAKLSVTYTQHTIFLLLTEKIAKAHQVTPSNKTWSSNLSSSRKNFLHNESHWRTAHTKKVPGISLAIHTWTLCTRTLDSIDF